MTGHSALYQDYPILEYDDTLEAVIEPSKVVAAGGVPERCVITFFQEVIDQLLEDGIIAQIDERRSEMGTHPVYSLPVKDQTVALIHPGLGAPLAAGLLEELIAKGCRKFVACGGAGVLDREITAGHLIAPVSAVRDEGTSYHYLPPTREVQPGAAALAAIKDTLEAHSIPYRMGKTWTTDAIFRETPGKVARRRAEGCLTVEMEAAAFFAVARFRGVEFAQILYGGDDVSGMEWDPRVDHKRGSTREKLLWLAAEAVLRID